MTRSADQITRLKDRIASYFIKAGGILVLSAMMGILFFLIWVTYPLFESTTVKKSRQLANIEIESMLSDSTGSASITLDKKKWDFLDGPSKGSHPFELS